MPEPVRKKGLREGEADLFRRFQEQDDHRAKEEIFFRYEYLLNHFARRYHSDKVPFDDVYQIAALGLLKAIYRFNAGQGTAFVTFAFPTIEGEIKKHYRDKADIIRLPRNIYERRKTVAKAVEKLMAESGRSPTIGELACELGYSEEEVIESIAAENSRPTYSLDYQISNEGEGEGSQLQDQIGIEEGGYALSERLQLLKHAIAKLPEKKKRILARKINDGWTQQQIAEELGISQMHVSRLLRGALEYLKEECEV
ncbi:MAG: sigma-70 family RNA polymerase sigma factor [Candidatus Geothermincolia bacterium]